jgi:hypothetical protein
VTHSHHAHAHPPAQGGASPAASAVPDAAHLLAHPDALRLAWADLVAGNAHLHGPEVAQRLGVPEAAMLAARIGHGATELVPDLAALLRPCGQWGKLLLACGFGQTVAAASVDYLPVSAFGTNTSLTIYYFLDGQLHKLLGARGTFTLAPGAWQYKVALNGNWSENYGIDGLRAVAHRDQRGPFLAQHGLHDHLVHLVVLGEQDAQPTEAFDAPGSARIDVVRRRRY